MNNIKVAKNPKTPKEYWIFQNFQNFPTCEFQNCAKSWLRHMNLNCVTLKRKLFPIDSLDVFHTSFLLFFIYCSCMFYYVCFSFLWYKGGENGFSKVLLHMVYFYNLISHCLLWLYYEVLATVSMKAFGSSSSSHTFVASSN